MAGTLDGVADMRSMPMAEIPVVLPDGGQPLDADERLFASHPWPARTGEIRLDGLSLVVRPVLPTDVAAISDLVAGLSERSAYFRFHSPVHLLSAAQLAGLVDIDHLERETLVALVPGRKAMLRLVGIGQYVATGPREVEMALVVADAWQRRGIGRALAERLLPAASDAGYDTVRASVLAENRAALALMRSLGFTAPAASVGPVLELSHRLDAPTSQEVDGGAQDERRLIPVAG